MDYAYDRMPLDMVKELRAQRLIDSGAFVPQFRLVPALFAAGLVCIPPGMEKARWRYINEHHETLYGLTECLQRAGEVVLSAFDNEWWGCTSVFIRENQLLQIVADDLYGWSVADDVLVGDDVYELSTGKHGRVDAVQVDRKEDSTYGFLQLVVLVQWDDDTYDYVQRRDVRLERG